MNASSPTGSFPPGGDQGNHLGHGGLLETAIRTGSRPDNRQETSDA